MQKLYWRPAHVSRIVHVLVAVIAVATLFSAEGFQVVHVQPHFEQKLDAAKRMHRGIEIVRNYRVRNVAAVDKEIDPSGSGIIGFASSSTTTNTGSLKAKLTSANPNWAAVVVDLLLKAGAKPGDLIAIGVSGSFPSLNLAAFVAAEVLELDVVSIASAGSSSWGANIPGLSWLDMERLLNDAKVFSHRSVAASLGGIRDRALGMSRSGRRRLREAVKRNGLTLIDSAEEITSIEQRMEIYAEGAEGRRFVAYVNAGGSLVSIGPKAVKHLYRPGLNLKPHPRGLHVDSIMMRFLSDGVPVVNLTKVVPLAERYGLPVEPEDMPPVGHGTVFEKREHSRAVVGSLLGFLFLALYGLLRLELGARIGLGSGSSRKVEPMV